MWAVTAAVASLCGFSEVIAIHEPAWAKLLDRSFYGPEESTYEVMDERQNFSNYAQSVTGVGTYWLQNAVVGSSETTPPWSDPFANLYDHSEELEWSYSVTLMPNEAYIHSFKGMIMYGEEYFADMKSDPIRVVGRTLRTTSGGFHGHFYIPN